jgi:tRNA U34 5-carboxymethylaminomethyl modifying GTPase MnmE/TrmE
MRFSSKPSLFTVAIIGKPNVGKSTLFNKLFGSYNAIVDPTPGMTRDYKESISTLLGFPIKLIDTAGWEHTDYSQS